MRVTAAVLVVSFIVVAVLANTPFGVWIVFDVIGEDEPKPLPAIEGPLVIDGPLERTRQLLLPAAIEQPSGISTVGDEFLLATDQAEFFRITRDGSIIEEAALLEGLLLRRQGRVEAIASHKGTIHVAGELGFVAQFDQQSGLKPAAVAENLTAMDISGLTNHNGQLLGVNDGTFAIINLTAGEVIQLDPGERLKPGRSISELHLSGIASDGIRLFLVAENCSTVVVISGESLEVEGVYGIDEIDAQDMAVAGGELWVVVDHNLFDERPPMFLYAVPDPVSADQP